MVFPLESDGLLIAAVLLSIERLAYAWIYRWPAPFIALCRRINGSDPVDVLQQVFVAFKALQLAVFAAWCWHFGAKTGWPSDWFAPAGWLGIALIGIGQTLNATVFLRLGRVGVFYGNRFGRETEWSNEFPYSLVDHPQYVGTVMSIWGIFLILRYPHPDWLALPLLETVYYVLGALAERTPNVDATSFER